MSRAAYAAFAGCALIAAGTILPFKHVLYRDTNAFDGYGMVFVVLAAVAAAFVFYRRWIGATFCSLAVLFLLAIEFAKMEKIGAVASVITGALDPQGQFAGPLGLDVHADAGFYVIAAGASIVALAPLYARRDASGENGRGSAGSGSEGD